jgi:glycosyltransferase involved in cell wall biosynthesis
MYSGSHERGESPSNDGAAEYDGVVVNAAREPLKILFIHEVNYTNKVIFEMHEFPELLALRGHDVTFFHYPEAPTVPRVSWRTTRERIVGRAYPEAMIELVTPPTWGGRPIERYLAPILNYWPLRREIARGGYDAVVLYAVPTTGWQATAVAKRHRVPLVFRALDVSHKIRKSPVSALIRRAERYIYRNAALLSANNPAMAEYCVQESGRTGPTVVNLPPIDLGHFTAEGVESKRRELGIGDDKKVVMYMGSFFGFSGLDTVVRMFADEVKAHPELVLLLVGGGELDGELRRLVAQLGLGDSVIFTGLVPYATLPSYLQAAEVAINPFVPELLTHVAFPHKVLQYMAAGVPAVSTSLRGLRGVLGDESGVTWVDQPGQVLAAAVELALQSDAAREAISVAQRALITRLFSKEDATISLENTLVSL